MLGILLLFSIIPFGPRLDAYNESTIIIGAPHQLCYDVTIAYADAVEPDWRVNGGAFPFWISKANQAKEDGYVY